MGVTFTEQQIRAINEEGRVIVSASAGSGKTKVMIERFVKLIVEEGGDIRSILAVTFTNKAAAQMREKLRGALTERLKTAQGSERERLVGQLNALPLADISTIHAFCARLVRSNFYLADVDPAFRVISPDDADGKMLSARAMDEVFETLYEEESEKLRSLLSVYFRRKKDAKLRDIVKEIYGAVRGMSDYRVRLASAGSDEFGCVCEYLAAAYHNEAQYYFDCAEELFNEFSEESERAQNVSKAVMAAASALLHGDLFAIVAAAEITPPIPPCPPSTKATGARLKNLKQLSSLSAGVKELYKKLQKYENYEIEYARYLDGQSRAAALAGLVLSYDDVYTQSKREAGVLDYDDLEHYALKVLEQEDACAAVREKYRYVFVDEYQDVNPAQDGILTKICSENVFLVGDMKQSIYGFRGSRSKFFADKFKSFEHALLLTKNFRSGMGVLDTVNLVFSRAMTEETSDVIYVREPMLGSERYAGHDGGTVFHRIPKEVKEKTPPETVYSVLAHTGATETDAQAECIVRAIRAERGSEYFDADAGLVKTVDWRDIAVLVRKNTGDMERIVAALARQGIPVTTAAKVNIFDFWEARLIVDWLSYLDNAEQDIPLAGAMLSAVGGFVEDDLTKIRLRFPSAPTFRAACKFYADQNKMDDELSKRLRIFFQKTEELRLFALVSTARSVLLKLLSAGLETEIAAKQHGAKRLMRVRRLVAEAEGSVHEFLMRLARSGYKIDFSEGGGENAVKVLTMHASKGLEYPVVMLASLDVPFHGAEHGEVVFTEKFGVAPRSFSVEKKLIYDTVLRRASAIYEEREELKQELNLLYVAMTRAMYRLHLFFGDCPRAPAPRFAKRFSDFFDFSALSRLFCEDGEILPDAAERPAMESRADEKLEAAITAVLCRDYPAKESCALPVKSSATELMQRMRPAMHYGEKTGGLTPTADTGTAYHLFLQYVDFSKDAATEYGRMCEAGILTPESARLLDKEKLAEILDMPCFRSLAGKTLLREQQFLVSLPAEEIFNAGGGDEVVFQGAIDLLAEGADGTTIIDYKFSSHDDARIRRDYAAQINLYKKAVARIRKIEERTVKAIIVNILQCREIEM